jgi:hypothetical protein
MSMVPVRADPFTRGVKLTLILQLAAAGSVAPQSVESILKSPDSSARKSSRP